MLSCGWSLVPSWHQRSRRLCSRRQVGDGAVLSLAMHGRALTKLNISFCSLSEAAIFELVQVAVHVVPA